MLGCNGKFNAAVPDADEKKKNQLYMKGVFQRVLRTGA